MRETLLMKVSIMFSILGFVCIFFFVSYMSYEPQEIVSFHEKPPGETVNFTCMVKDVTNTEDGHLFLDVFDETSEIRVIIWSDTAKRINETIVRGSFMSILGTLELYKGEREVIARKIVVLN